MPVHNTDCKTARRSRNAVRNDSLRPERRTDVPRAPRAEFRQGLGREATGARSAHPKETRIYRAFLPQFRALPNVSQVEAP